MFSIICMGVVFVHVSVDAHGGPSWVPLDPTDRYKPSYKNEYGGPNMGPM